jgi:hypothetical protein
MKTLHIAPAVLLATLAGCAPAAKDLDSNVGEAAQADSTGEPTASNVAISGTPATRSTLTGSYTFSDLSGFSESGSTYQWYRVDPSTGDRLPIAGATGETYVVQGADTNGLLAFCVTPSDGTATGPQVCSADLSVPGVIWFTGESWTGSSVDVASSDGACVAISSVGLPGTARSAILNGLQTESPTMLMYTGANCTGSVYSRSTGVNNQHAINLDTVGIGSNLVSYKISWSGDPAASNVMISGTPVTQSTLTGSYTFSDLSGYSESGSTYQWYRVDPSTGDLAAIAGATSETYVVQGADTNGLLAFCVTPADSATAGEEVCSANIFVPGVIWFTGESWTGESVDVASTNGACVAISSVGLPGTAASLILNGEQSVEASISMYTGPNCTGSEYYRYTGVNNQHSINLGSVGIGSNLVSYSISW